MSGSLPFDLRLTFDPRQGATVLRRNALVGSGVIALATSEEDIRRRPARPAYYDRLRPYRQRAGLSAHSLRHGPVEIKDFELEGRISQGMLLVDWITMNILGGDINGNMAVQIGRDASALADLSFKVWNIDASYFKALNLQPGPQSELSADLQFGFMSDAAALGTNPSIANLQSLLLGKKHFAIIIVYLCVLYSITTIVILPERLPTTILAYVLIFLWYVVAFILLWLDKVTPVAAPLKTQLFTERELAICAVLVMGATIICSLISQITYIVLLVMFISLMSAGVILFFVSLFSLLRHWISNSQA